MIVKVTNSDGKQVFAAKVDDDCYIDIFGGIHHDNSKVTHTRNVPAETREGLEKAAALHKKAEKERQVWKQAVQQHNRILWDCEEQAGKALAAARKASGVLNRQEFAQAFWAHIPETVKEEIDRKGFSLKTPDNLCYSFRGLYLSYGKQIGKWVRNISYTYREYDGQLFIVDEPEKYEQYRQHLSKYGKRLDRVRKGTTFTEAISAGDKDSLWYNCCYEFPLPDSLTEENAAKLAVKVFPVKAGR